MNNVTTTLSTINTVSDLLRHLENDVVEGNADALEVMVKFKTAIDRVKKFESTVKQYALDQASTRPVKTFHEHGATITYRVGSAMLDYEQDDVYKELKIKLDARKKLLDTIFKSNSKGIVDDDGVLVEGVPVAKYRADSMTIKID